MMLRLVSSLFSKIVSATFIPPLNVPPGMSTWGIHTVYICSLAYSRISLRCTYIVAPKQRGVCGCASAPSTLGTSTACSWATCLPYFCLADAEACQSGSCVQGYGAQARKHYAATASRWHIILYVILSLRYRSAFIRNGAHNRLFQSIGEPQQSTSGQIHCEPRAPHGTDYVYSFWN